MKRTEMITLKFFIEIHKVWPAGHALWPWQHAIDRLASILGNIDSSGHTPVQRCL